MQPVEPEQAHPVEGCATVGADIVQALDGALAVAEQNHLFPQDLHAHWLVLHLLRDACRSPELSQEAHAHQGGQDHPMVASTNLRVIDNASRQDRHHVWRRRLLLLTCCVPEIAQVHPAASQLLHAVPNLCGARVQLARPQAQALPPLSKRACVQHLCSSNMAQLR